MQKTVTIYYSYRKLPFPVKKTGWFQITAESLEDCCMKAAKKFNQEIAHYSETYIAFDIINKDDIIQAFQRA